MKIIKTLTSLFAVFTAGESLKENGLQQSEVLPSDDFNGLVGNDESFLLQLEDEYIGQYQTLYEELNNPKFPMASKHWSPETYRQWFELCKEADTVLSETRESGYGKQYYENRIKISDLMARVPLTEHIDAHSKTGKHDPSILTDSEIEDFRELVRTDPEELEKTHIRAKNSGDKRSRIRDLSKIISVNPSYGQSVYWQRADYLRKLGLEEKALEDYTREIEFRGKEKEDAVLWECKGELLLKMGRKDEALEDFRNSVNVLQPHLFQRGIVHRKIANILYEEGLLEEALESVNDSINILDSGGYLDRFVSDSFALRSFIHHDLGMRKESVEDMEEANRLDPRRHIIGSWFFQNRAAFHFENGHLDSALDDLNEAIRIDPEGKHLHFDRAFIYRKKGLNEEAMQDYNREIELNPNYVPTYGKKRALNLEMGHYVKMVTEDSVLSALALGTGVILAMMGAATAYANKAKQGDSEDSLFRSDEESRGAIKHYARSIVSTLISSDNLSANEEAALLQINEQQADEIFQIIANPMVKREIHHASGSKSLKYRFFFQNYNEEEGKGIKDIEIELLEADVYLSREALDRKYSRQISEEFKKAVREQIQDQLSYIEDEDLRDELQDTLISLREFINENKMVKTFSRVQSGETKQKSHIYDNLLPEGVKYSKINKEKFSWAIDIFNEEIHQYLKEIHSNVHEEEVKEKVGELLRDMVSTTIEEESQKPGSQVSVNEIVEPYSSKARHK